MVIDIRLRQVQIVCSVLLDPGQLRSCSIVVLAETRNDGDLAATDGVTMLLRIEAALALSHPIIGRLWSFLTSDVAMLAPCVAFGGLTGAGVTVRHRT
ncbi:hypothetical protein [uncultured Roseobacter sp.]|uniref:hypothetical protein n=1 Tax=uncultured Roseobacter sp. TaxID=114847 RepID=UPI00262DDEA3|nr:hypothetical protein [uncultured Roseobacter sp.]